MPKISVPQKNLSFDVKSGTNLMNALLEAGIPVASSCHGDGICSMCRMQVQGTVAPPTDFEASALKRNKAQVGERLSCQVSVENDIVVKTRYW